MAIVAYSMPCTIAQWQPCRRGVGRIPPVVAIAITIATAHGNLPHAEAQCVRYSVSWPSPPTCQFTQPGALGFALNESADIVGVTGTCSGYDPPFAWFGSGPISPMTLPSPFNEGQARDVNASREVVGWMVNWSSVLPRPFRLTDGILTPLEVLPDTGDSQALGISDAGLVVGYCNNSQPRACLWNSGGIQLLVLPLGPSSVAEDVNSLHQICGWMGVLPAPGFMAHAFKWQNGVTTDLGVPPGATATAATGINSVGDVCGYAVWPSGDGKTFIRRACAWINGQFIDLGVISGELHSRATDINDAGEIVGFCWGGPNGNPLMPAFIWRNGVLTSFGDHVALTSPRLSAAHGINNSGQITGEANLGNGHSAAFLLTPALPATPGDTDCTGSVNINDLLDVLNNWNPQGPVGGNPADLDRDNRININDLLEVINHWG